MSMSDLKRGGSVANMPSMMPRGNSLSQQPLNFVKASALPQAERKAALQTLAQTMQNEAYLEANFNHYLQLISTQEPEFAPIAFAALIQIARDSPKLLKYNAHVKLVETQLQQILTNTRVVTEPKQVTGILGLIKPSPVVATEIDGSIAREAFTVLNNTTSYSSEQQFNISIFSSLYSWLHLVYYSRRVKDDSESDQQGEVLASNTNEFQLDAGFEEAIVNYCFRLIEQSKLKNVGVKEAGQTTDIPEIALKEAIRVLDLLCKLNESLIARVIPTMKGIFVRGTTKNNGQILISLLQFFINHSESVLYDPDPNYRIYFQTFLPANYTNISVCFETLLFCSSNKKKLLSSTNVFTKYYPPLIKLFAWNPQTSFKLFSDILPALIGPKTYIELFHYILDLPIVAAALEKLEAERNKTDTDEPHEKYRVLYNHLLRNETVSLNTNFWEPSSTQPLLIPFCEAAPRTSRILANAKLAPLLLSIFFDVLIEYADEACMIELLPILFQRLDQLYPMPQFQSTVRRLLVDKVLLIFNKFPSFVVSLKDLIIDSIKDSSESRGELILTLIWIVGEYVNAYPYTQCTNEILAKYHDALELFAFERMTPYFQPMVSEQKFSKNGYDIFTTRSMLIVISSLAKLATKWPESASRVRLCLVKLTRCQQYFDPAVLVRALECIQLLKFPSIAPAILGATHQSLEKRFSHIDENSPLPFIVQPMAGYSEGESLHPWTLYKDKRSYD